MVGEEIGINDFLEANGIEPVETDLGEYIIQLRHETRATSSVRRSMSPNARSRRPSSKAHTDLEAGRNLDEASSLMAEARAKCVARFLAADVGITGANFLIAETGSTVIVTNEGNGDLTQTLRRCTSCWPSIEKVVPTIEDAMTLLRILPLLG